MYSCEKQVEHEKLKCNHALTVTVNMEKFAYLVNSQIQWLLWQKLKPWNKYPPPLPSNQPKHQQKKKREKKNKTFQKDSF